jgi:hypothetical protein
MIEKIEGGPRKNRRKRKAYRRYQRKFEDVRRIEHAEKMFHY